MIWRGLLRFSVAVDGVIVVSCKVVGIGFVNFIVMTVWLKVSVFVYEQRSCGFESRCSHLNLRVMVLEFHSSFEGYFCWERGRVK